MCLFVFANKKVFCLTTFARDSFSEKRLPKEHAKCAYISGKLLLKINLLLLKKEDDDDDETSASAATRGCCWLPVASAGNK